MTIDELEQWFRKARAPEMPVYLNQAMRVNDYDLFITAHFEGLRAAPNEFIKAPLMKRLLEMKLLTEANQ